MSSGIGNRREKRVAAVVPVRVWGMDAQGRPFIEISRTVNISRSGVLLGDIPAKLSIGDIVGLTYAEKKHKFRVIWTGKAETPEAANVGLQSLDSGKWIWDLNLPAHEVDIYSRAPEHEKRLLARVGCLLSKEVWWQAKDEKILAFITHLSLGGCYVTTTSPMPLKSRVRIALWLDDEAKTWSDGIVISSHRDVGMGIKFLGLSLHNQEAVERCIEAQKDSRQFVNSFTTAYPTQQK